MEETPGCNPFKEYSYVKPCDCSVLCRDALYWTMSVNCIRKTNDEAIVIVSTLLPSSNLLLLCPGHLVYSESVPNLLNKKHGYYLRAVLICLRCAGLSICSEPCFNPKTVFLGIWILKIKIWRPRDRLALMNGITIIVRRHIYIETATDGVYL